MAPSFVKCFLGTAVVSSTALELTSPPPAFVSNAAAVFEKPFGDQLTKDIGTRESFAPEFDDFVPFLTDASPTSLWNIPPHEGVNTPSVDTSPVRIPSTNINDIIQVFQQDPTLFVIYVIAHTGKIKTTKQGRKLIWSLADDPGEKSSSKRRGKGFDAHVKEFTTYWDHKGAQRKAQSVGGLAFTVSDAGGVTNVGRIYLLEQSDKHLTILARMVAIDCPMVARTFSTNTAWHFEARANGDVVFTPRSWWYTYLSCIQIERK